ncbi:MAG TPA: chromosomal replication initiator protein DnaA [Syntrophobacteraceae bacterium]|nr:chromosomal replication initiator protein DnaA [Syntrophobacteraceae bacterium]
MDQQWRQIKGELEKVLSRGQYDLWVTTIEFLGVQDGRLCLGCRSRFHIEWLRGKLENKLLDTARAFFPQVRRVEYEVVKDVEDPPAEAREDWPRQLSFHEVVRRPEPVYNRRFTFDQFVVGGCNQFAYAACLGMASGQCLYNQSVYLLSETGLGKSHLSHAVGNYLLSSKPETRVHYVTAEQFANEMISALRNGSMEVFKSKFRADCDVFLLEKVEFLSGKEKVQAELVYTLDELMNRGKRILCTGSSHPKQIPKLNSDLQSRLSGILVAPIEPPDFETRVEIIRSKAKGENLVLPRGVAEYLAERVSGDVRRIESCLVGLIAKTNILGVPLTLQLAEEVTQTMLENLPKIDMQRIQEVVCSVFQITLEDLKSPSRRKEVAMARKMGMYLARMYTSESLVSIARSFQRSHSAVVHAVKDLTREMEDSGSKVRRQVEYVSRRLETTCLTS